MITKKQYNELKNKIEELEAVFNGGKGSGNFGHLGRPGKVGGSSSGGGYGGSNSKNIDDEIEKTKKEIEELGDFLGSIPPSGILSSEMGNIEKVSKELEKARRKLEELEKGEAGTKDSGGKYDVKDGKEARKYLTADGKMSIPTPEAFGFTYDELGKPIRLSRFEKKADDKLWGAWASMQKVQDDGNLGDVREEGLATAGDAMRLAKAVISTSQTAYLPSEREAAKRQTEQFVKGVKDEVKRAKITLAADAKRYGDTEVRRATRKALDDISSAMDGFLGYETPSREYRD